MAFVSQVVVVSVANWPEPYFLVMQNWQLFAGRFSRFIGHHFFSFDTFDCVNVRLCDSTRMDLRLDRLALSGNQFLASLQSRTDRSGLTLSHLHFPAISHYWPVNTIRVQTGKWFRKALARYCFSKSLPRRKIDAVLTKPFTWPTIWKHKQNRHECMSVSVCVSVFYQLNSTSGRSWPAATFAD